MDESGIIALAERLGLSRAVELMSSEVIAAAEAAEAERKALAPLDTAVEPWRPKQRL